MRCRDFFCFYKVQESWFPLVEPQWSRTTETVAGMMRGEKAAHCDMEEQLVLIITILEGWVLCLYFSYACTLCDHKKDS